MNEAQLDAKEKRVPRWAWAPLKGFRDYAQQEADLMLLSTTGVSRLAESVPLAEALEKLERLDLAGGEAKNLNEPGEHVIRARRLAELARREIDSDFRLLHGHALVGIWGALETMVADLVAAWLLNIREARRIPVIAEIKVSLAEFESLSSEERIDALVNELDRRNTSRSGIARFEGLLNSVLLGGSYPATISENLYAMQQVRNVFAHRRGVADRRFVDACPWLALRVGEVVPLGAEAWITYVATTAAYATTIGNRVRSHFGLEPVEMAQVESIGRRPG